MNIEKQVGYWLVGAEEDREVAEKLVREGKVRHGLFFCHLALEKTLKACICKRLKVYPPRVHNLVRLAEAAELTLSQDFLEILADMNQYNLE